MKKRAVTYLALVAGLAFLLWGTLNLNSAQAQTPAPPGSYTQTCSNITFAGTPGQTPLTLSATCRTANGGTQQTSIVYDIANCNGNLAWAPNGC